MRSVGMAFALTGLAAGMLPAASAQAAEPDWKAGAVAYAKARDTAVKSKAQPDYALCAGTWAAWDDTLSDGKLTDGVLGMLDPDLGADSSDEKVNLWRLWLGDDARRFDLFDMHRQAVKAQIAQALAGDRPTLLTVMTALGGCQLPKDK